jgi:surfactin synthase thioesterase subunit
VSGSAQQGPSSKSTPPKLYIFPHAGASVDFYVPFSRAFSAEIKRVAVQYPRRRACHDLPPMTSIPALADDIYKMLTASDESGSDVALFAHSMGAMFAFEVARRYESTGNPIAALFVSASAAPSRMQYEHLPGSDRQLLDAVTDVTGLKPEFLENEQFATTILPTLRSLRAIADYACPPGATVSCPIYAFLGDNDEIATYEDVVAWADHTTSEFGVRVFPGGHHYINGNLRELVKDIEAKISHCCRAD